MAPGRFVRENVLILLGISLPVLILLGALVLTSLPAMWVADPAYDFLFVDNNYNYGCQGSRFEVRKDKLEIVGTTYKEHCGNQRQELYLFEAKTGTIRELPYEIPTEGVRELVDATAQMTLDPRYTSPDGYKIDENGPSYRSDIFGIFGGSRCRGGMAIAKEGRVVRVQKGQDCYYRQQKFLGWIVSGEEK